MSDVAVGITYAVTPGFPAGSVVDHITVTMVGTDPANNPAPQNLPPDTPTVTFTSLNPDTYTITAQAFPATGDGFGTAVSTTATVEAGTITLSLPAAVTVTQSLNVPSQVNA